ERPDRGTKPARHHDRRSASERGFRQHQQHRMDGETVIAARIVFRSPRIHAGGFFVAPEQKACSKMFVHLTYPFVGGSGCSGGELMRSCAGLLCALLLASMVVLFPKAAAQNAGEPVVPPSLELARQRAAAPSPLDKLSASAIPKLELFD